MRDTLHLDSQRAATKAIMAFASPPSTPNSAGLVRRLNQANSMTAAASAAGASTSVLRGTSSTGFGAGGYAASPASFQAANTSGSVFNTPNRSTGPAGGSSLRPSSTVNHSNRPGANSIGVAVAPTNNGNVGVKLASAGSGLLHVPTGIAASDLHRDYVGLVKVGTRLRLGCY